MVLGPRTLPRTNRRVRRSEAITADVFGLWSFHVNKGMVFDGADARLVHYFGSTSPLVARRAAPRHPFYAWLSML